ncbi:IclR family transcriptional regulator [Mesorhizobium sp.]|uniref:IclR family transcriptional regulator n=1 Tax=Mesorhizobium sp. TaxID=1871066 RepID=UPI0025EE0AE6|nr:IclR family transcriptional regulator [Mesorhizobium sp.]
MLGIFDAIAKSPDGLSLAELSSRLKSPKSSLLTLLRPMVGGNYLIHSNNRYTLGNESFILATNILSARKFSSLVRGLMMELQRSCPETIVLAVIDRAAQTAIYSDVIESPQLVRYSVPNGTSRPLYTSAAGQLLLAFQDDKWRDQYLRRVKLSPLTARTLTKVEQLRKKLNAIRQTGLSVSVSEAVEGATGVAAPIFGSDGAILAALLIAGPTDRYNREGENWGELAKDAAFRASRAIGFAGTAQEHD